MFCVRKRLLTIENDDENVLPNKLKKVKHDHHSTIKSSIYRPSIFNTPSTPANKQFTNSQQQLITPISNNKLMNMTNLQSTPTTIQNLQTSITPLCFNAIPNFNFDTINNNKSITPLTPDNSSIISNFNLNSTLSTTSQQQQQQTIDSFKTPTKQRKTTDCTVLGQLQNSPNSMIIPETPPKSSNNNRQDRKMPSSLRFTKLLNSPSPNLSAINNKSTLHVTATSAATTTIKSSNHKSSNINLLSNSLSSVNLNCKCFGLDQICKLCTKRNECMAPRAGTPGFRAPEVLLKHLCQTSAIDIWSVGVIFASLLTKKYPFFRNTDDLTSLAEIISNICSLTLGFRGSIQLDLGVL